MINKNMLFNLKKSLIAIVVGFVISFSIAALIKPELFFQLLKAVFIEPLARYQIKKVMLLSSVLIIVSLGVSFSFKASITNVGMPGQMLAGAMLPTIIATTYSSYLSFNGSWIILLLMGALFGGLVGGFTGYIKSKFNVHEVVSAIMINWIIFYLGKTIFQNPLFKEVGFPGSKMWPMALRPNLIACIVLAIGLLIVVWYIFNKTKFGYKITLTGEQPSVVTYAGYSKAKIQTTTLAISGTLAGLAGVIYYGAYSGQYIIPIFDQMDPIGFNAIIIALVAFNHPLLIGLVSVLFAIIYTGGYLGAIYVEYSGELISLALGIVLFIIVITSNISYKNKRQGRK